MIGTSGKFGKPTMLLSFPGCFRAIMLLAALLAWPAEAAFAQLELDTVSSLPVPTNEEEEKALDQKLLLALFHPLVGRYPVEDEREDLTFRNFFTFGWHVGWGEPEEGPADAPRFRLMRIQRAFWEREVRLTYNRAFGVEGGTLDAQEGEVELELPISRRFLIEFEGGFGVRGRICRASAKWRVMGYQWRRLEDHPRSDAF